MTPTIFIALTNSLITSYLHLQGERQIHHLQLRIQLTFWPFRDIAAPLPFGSQQSLNMSQEKNRPWEATPHPEKCHFTVLTSQYLHPTGWKHHTRTSQNSYRCPSPRTWPRYILSSDLTPQTRHTSDILCLCWQGRWTETPVSHVCWRKRKVGVSPPVPQQV